MKTAAVLRPLPSHDAQPELTAALRPLPALQLLQRGEHRTCVSPMPQEAHLAPSHEDVYAPSHEDVCYNEAPKSWSWRDKHLAALCIALARGFPGHCSVGHSCE